MGVHRFLSKAVLIAACWGIVCLNPAKEPSHAQATEPDHLQSRIKQLEARVRELETLLNECRQGVKVSQPEQFGWQNKKNWRRLSLGMQEGQVKATLGEPSKVIQGVKTLWYYPNIYCGYVSFDEKGRLIGWNEP